MSQSVVRVGIIDTGFDVNHPWIDRSLIDTGGSYNHTSGSKTDLGVAGQTHGQMVLGAMAYFDARNPAALDPALPDSVQFELHSTDLSVGQLRDALNATHDTDVVNMSFGFTTPFGDSLYNSFYTTFVWQPLMTGAQYGRNGLGVTYVTAAGNARGYDDSGFHHLQNNEFVIAVAAVDAQEKVGWFSSPGENLLIAAHGVNVITTAVRSVAGGDLVRASGTSFAAPNASVVVARMLEVNGDLGYRDVQTILALSARDPVSAETGVGANAAKGWNGGGLTYSRDLGFGIADVEAAVSLAETWQGSATWANRAVAGSTQTFTSSTGALVHGTPFERSFSVGGSIDVEHVSLRVEILHADFNDLVIEVVSPGGTVSRVMANSLQPGQVSGGLGFDFGIRRFMGEDAEGSWTVRVTDTRDSAQTGWVAKLGLTVTGKAGGADDLYVYTDDFGANWTAARSLYDDADGANTLNFAAITGPVVLDMTGQTASLVAGRALTIAAGATASTVFLGSAGDTFTGAATAETVHLRGGNDVAATGAGDDVIHHSAGNDRVDGGAGLDTLSFAVRVAEATWSLLADGWARFVTPTSTVVSYAIEVFRFLDATLGFDDLFPSSGPIVGTRDAETLEGTARNDTIDAQGGNDTLKASAGDDSLMGGSGHDTADYSGLGLGIALAAGVVTKSPGTDQLSGIETVIGTATGDDLAAGAGVVRLYGDGGDDTLRGATQRDSLHGGDGDDLIHASGLADLIDGGAGFDSVSYAEETSGISYRYGRVTKGDDSIDMLVSIEHVIGTAAADRIVAYYETLAVDGGAGDDIVHGGMGTDILRGGDGNDELVAYNPAGSRATNLATDDTLDGGAGDDLLTGSLGDNLLIGGDGNDVIDGGAGHDTAVFSGAMADYSFRLIDDFGLRVTHSATGWQDRLFNVEDLAFDDGTVAAAAIMEPLAAIGLTMVHYGSADADSLGGHIGRDLFHSSAGADTYRGGDGFDTLSYAAEARGVNVSAGTAIDGSGSRDLFWGIECIEGSAHADRLYGHADAIVVLGGGGDDTIRGSRAADVLDGGDGVDNLRGWDGRDLLFDGDGTAMLYGDGGDDVLIFATDHAGDVFGGSGHDAAVITGDGALRIASMATTSVETYLGAGDDAAPSLTFERLATGPLGVFGVDALIFETVTDVRRGDGSGAEVHADALGMASLGLAIATGRDEASSWADADPAAAAMDGWHHVELLSRHGVTSLWTDADAVQIAGGHWVDLAVI